MAPSNEEKSQVSFCEEYLQVTFTGDIENRQDVKQFLDEYLDEAERMYNELKCEYEAYYLECL